MIRFDKMRFPLFIYIKPPDDAILQHLVPTVWWQSSQVTDSSADSERKEAYFMSCEKLQSHVREMEDIQVSAGSLLTL